MENGFQIAAGGEMDDEGVGSRHCLLRGPIIASPRDRMMQLQTYCMGSRWRHKLLAPAMPVGRINLQVGGERIHVYAWRPWLGTPIPTPVLAGTGRRRTYSRGQRRAWAHTAYTFKCVTRTNNVVATLYFSTFKIWLVKDNWTTFY